MHSSLDGYHHHRSTGEKRISRLAKLLWSMFYSRGILLSLATSLVLLSTLSLLPSVATVARVSDQTTIQATSDPCTTIQLQFSFGTFTVCTSKPSYRFSDTVDIAMTVKASYDLAFKSMTMEVVYHGSTIFSSTQVCMIPEGCIVKAGQTISAQFSWDPIPPAGSYTIRGTLYYDFPCAVQQPPCLIIPSPLPAVADVTIMVLGSRGSAIPI